MTRKKIADNPALASDSAAANAPAQKKSRAPRASSTAVTHKHKKAPVAAAEPVAEIPAPVHPVAAPPAAAQQISPTHEEIALRAWLYFEARGYQGGSQEEDWLRAERELKENRRS